MHINLHTNCILIRSVGVSAAELWASQGKRVGTLTLSVQRDGPIDDTASLMVKRDGSTATNPVIAATATTTTATATTTTSSKATADNAATVNEVVPSSISDAAGGAAVTTTTTATTTTTTTKTKTAPGKAAKDPFVYLLIDQIKGENISENALKGSSSGSSSSSSSSSGFNMFGTPVPHLKFTVGMESRETQK